MVEVGSLGVHTVCTRVRQHHQGENSGGEDDIQMISSLETIELDGEAGQWTGRNPSSIDGEANPTLRIYVDEDYAPRGRT